MRSKRLFCLGSLVVLGLVLLLGLTTATAAAPPVASGAQAVILPTSQLVVSPATVRTQAQMQAAAAAEAAGPATPVRVIPLRPTRGEAAYQAEKAAAAQSLGQPALATPGLQGAIPLAPTTALFADFDGVQFGTGPGQAGNSYPPDTEGAVGPNHFVEITNTHVDIYQKAAPHTRVNGAGNGVTLSAFFGYTTQGLFDPRVIFDPVAQRWILSADAFAESSTVQKFFFAVSKTADPLGDYFIYNVNVSNNLGATGGVEWDFPMLGMDQNALIFSANFFNRLGVYVDTRMFAVAKSLVYNGPSQTLTPHLFTGLLGTTGGGGTLAVPIVLDANPNTYMVMADNSGSTVSLYTLTNSGANLPSLSVPVPITVDAYTAPPNAPQLSVANLIDTSDSRFVNASTQIGNSLFQVHAINIGGLARPRFYEFDTVNHNVIQSGTFSRSSTSYDFNASLAANHHKDVFVTWTATDPNNPDPNNRVNAEVRFSGRLHTDPAGVIPSPGGLLFTSTSALTGNPIPGSTIQRWGDYSAVSIDPADRTGATAWIVNETIVNSSTWGSRIGSIGLPPWRTPVGAMDLLLLQ